MADLGGGGGATSRGRAAAGALFQPLSARCYALLAVDEFARRQPAALSAAHARRRAFLSLADVSLAPPPSPRRDWVSMAVADGPSGVEHVVQEERVVADPGEQRVDAFGSHLLVQPS